MFISPTTDKNSHTSFTLPTHISKDHWIKLWATLNRSEVNEFLVVNDWLDPIIEPNETARVLYEIHNKYSYFTRTTSILDLEISTTISSIDKYSSFNIHDLSKNDPEKLNHFAKCLNVKPSNIHQVKNRVIRILQFADLLTDQFIFNHIPPEIYNEITLFMDIPDVLNYFKAFNVNEEEQSIYWANKLERDFGVSGRLNGKYQTNKIGSKYQYIEYAKEAGQLHLYTDTSIAKYDKYKSYIKYISWTKIISIVNAAKSGNFYSALLQASRFDSFNQDDNQPYFLHHMLYYIGISIYHKHNMTTIPEFLHKYYSVSYTKTIDNSNQKISDPIFQSLFVKRLMKSNKNTDTLEHLQNINTNILNYFIEKSHYSYPEYIQNLPTQNVEQNLYLTYTINHSTDLIILMGLTIGAIITNNQQFLTSSHMWKIDSYEYIFAQYMADIILNKSDKFSQYLKLESSIEPNIALVWILYAAIFDSVDVLNILLSFDQKYKNLFDRFDDYMPDMKKPEFLAFLANFAGPKTVSHIFDIALHQNIIHEFLEHIFGRVFGTDEYILHVVIIRKMGEQNWIKVFENHDDKLMGINYIIKLKHELFEFLKRNIYLLNADDTLNVVNYQLTKTTLDALIKLGVTHEEIMLVSLNTDVTPKIHEILSTMY